jgi:hypothetical protein
LFGIWNKLIGAGKPCRTFFAFLAERVAANPFQLQKGTGHSPVPTPAPTRY